MLHNKRKFTPQEVLWQIFNVSNIKSLLVLLTYFITGCIIPCFDVYLSVSL